MNQNESSNQWSERINACIAHRGWSSRAPENTIASIKLAMGLSGVYAIEIDVHLSRDGVPVVIHDHTLKRTTNGNGLVKDHTYDELSALDAGSWFSPNFAGETIPTLESVLQVVRGKCKLNIEIKAADMLLEKKIVDLINRYHMQSEVIITSFNHKSVKRAKELDVNLQTGLVHVYRPLLLLRKRLKKIGATVLAMNYHYCTRNFVTEMIEDGIFVIAWTVDDLMSIEVMAKMHPQVAICTNYPERVISLRSQIK